MISFEELNSTYPVDMLLSQLGLQNISDKGAYFLFSSPFREDKNPSMVLYKNNLMCIDFGSQDKMHLFKFVRELSGKTIYDITGIDKKVIATQMYFNQKKKETKKREDKQESFKLQIQGEMYWNPYKNEKVIKFLLNRHVSKGFIKEFKIGYCEKAFIKGIRCEEDKQLKSTPFFNRVCIPIYENNKLISLEGRDFIGGQKAKVLYPKNASVSTLFNIDNLDRNKPLYIVEGIMDMPRIWKHISKNVTTTFGINVNARQKEFLQSFSHIIIVPDADRGGNDFVVSFDDWYDKDFWVSPLPYGDPGDVDLQTLLSACNNPIESPRFFINKSGVFDYKRTSVNLSFWKF